MSETRSGLTPYPCDLIPIAYEDLPEEIKERSAGNQFSGLYYDGDKLYARHVSYAWAIVNPLDHEQTK